MFQPDDDTSAADGADEPGASFVGMLRPMSASEVIEQRLRVGWSQSQLARAIGYSQRQVSHWERGERGVPQAASAAILTAVARQCAVDEDLRWKRYVAHRAARTFYRLVERLSGV